MVAIFIWVKKVKLNLSTIDTNNVFDKLREEYKIYGPVKRDFKGTMSDTPSIRYEEVNYINEIEFDEKSDFSAKEIILPITQVLFTFTEEEYSEPTKSQDKILLFVRACDINGIRSLDLMYQNNGPKDEYYCQARERITFVLIGCEKSFRNCFCVSMGSNKSDNYALGFKPVGDNVHIEVKDDNFSKYFDEPTDDKFDFEMDFVTENKEVVNLPIIKDTKIVSELDTWREYDSRCIGCGKCNFVCPTCSCFAMQDVYYQENKNIGERRRVWASCQIEGYSDMAGGHSFRQKNGDKMRFKALHKVHDFKQRFGEHMCTGCGRCTDACPSYISFSATINKLDKAVKELS